MPEWGDPISYLALAAGTAVLTADQGRIGTVEQVLYVEAEDVFDGIVVGTADGTRFVDRDQIDAIYERAVVTTLSAEQAAALPAPEGGAPVYEVDPTVGQGHSLRDWYNRVFRKGGGWEKGTPEN